jgi:regulator of cell morphogenesis and NO signaling
MKIREENTVASVVAENIKSAHVFKKHGIDFCCGGGISIEKACAKNNVEYKQLEKEILAIDSVVSPNNDFNGWKLDVLIDHIVNTHHTYVSESIPLILQYSNKVAHVHGDHYKEVVEINSIFTEVANELLLHMQKEEHVLFPFIKQLHHAKTEGKQSEQPHFGTVQNPIRMMEHEHENAGDAFKKIAELSNDFTPPEEACNTFKALYAILDEFEQDLHRHIHLENNIVHPKAIALEQELAS